MIGRRFYYLKETNLKYKIICIKIVINFIIIKIKTTNFFLILYKIKHILIIINIIKFCLIIVETIRNELLVYH